MSINLTCWDYIIGLSRTACASYSPSIQDRESDSGLYLDEILPLHKFESVLNCEEGTDIFDYMERARENAIIAFRSDGNRMLLEYNRLKRQPFKGIIGKVKTTKVLSLTADNYYGVRIYCSDIVSGVLKIKTIGTIFNTTGVITIYICNNFNELLYSFDINTTANTHQINDVTAHLIELPLHSDYVENLEYFIYYQLAANLPLDNEYYNSRFGLSKEGHPIFKSQSNKQFGWLDYLYVNGYSSSDTSDLSGVVGTSQSRMYGLTFGIELRCLIDEIWCMSELDYLGDTLAMEMAWAVGLKAADMLIDEIAMSENLDRETMIEGQTLGMMQDEYRAKYNKKMKSIVENFDITVNDCFECKDRIDISKTYIKTK